MSQRVQRVNESVRETLAELLVDVKDPRIGFVTVTDVRTTPDLRHSEVYYTVLPDSEDARTDTQAGLRSALPMLRRELAGRLRLRYVPELEFTHDPVPAQGRHIERLLDDAREGSAAEPPDGADDADR